MKRAIFATVFLASTALMGQGVLGLGNFIHVVANLDRSIEFYHDALGLEMTGAPGPHAFSANAVVSSLYDAPGAQSRVVSFKIPDSAMAIEIVEFQGLNTTPVSPRFFDPGAITLSLTVPDLEAVETRLHRIQGLEWISASATGSVVVRDPDGIFVNLVQPRKGRGGSNPPAAALEDPFTAPLGVTVADVARTSRFYSQALGFSPVTLENRGYAGQKPVHSSIHDPGSGVLRLRVDDFDAW